MESSFILIYERVETADSPVADSGNNDKYGLFLRNDNVKIQEEGLKWGMGNDTTKYLYDADNNVPSNSAPPIENILEDNSNENFTNVYNLYIKNDNIQSSPSNSKLEISEVPVDKNTVQVLITNSLPSHYDYDYDFPALTPIIINEMDFKFIPGLVFSFEKVQQIDSFCNIFQKDKRINEIIADANFKIYFFENELTLLTTQFINCEIGVDVFVYFKLFLVCSFFIVRNSLCTEAKSLIVQQVNDNEIEYCKKLSLYKKKYEKNVLQEQNAYNSVNSSLLTFLNLEQRFTHNYKSEHEFKNIFISVKNPSQNEIRKKILEELLETPSRPFINLNL